MIRLFTILPFLFILSAQTYIYPGIYGNELSELIFNEYKTSTTLGYNPARDTMYSVIDNYNGSVSCIYTDFSVDLISGTDPSTTMYQGGINCEHAWPQSMGASSEPMKSDLHHLFPVFLFVCNLAPSATYSPFLSNGGFQFSTCDIR